MSKNVAMFVDVANMYYAARGQDVDVDYVALLKHASKGRDLIRAYAYTGLDPENENQRKFIDFLAKNGYRPVVKDIRKFGDGRMKANLDIELVVDLFRLADRMDIAVIVSGDGDFAPAIRALQDKGVRCEVISFKPNTSSDLVAVADEFEDIMKIASTSRRKPGEAAGPVGTPEMPAKEVTPEFGFREASPSVAAAALAALRGGGVSSDGRRGRATTTRRSSRSRTAAAAQAPAELPPGEIVATAAETTAETEEQARRRRRRRGGRGRGRGRRDEAAQEVAAEPVSEEIGWQEFDDLSQLDLGEEREISFEEADAATLAELGLSPEALGQTAPDGSAEDAAAKPPRGGRSGRGTSARGTRAKKTGDDAPKPRRRTPRSKAGDEAAEGGGENVAEAGAGETKPAARRRGSRAKKPDAEASGGAGSAASSEAVSADRDDEPQGIWGRFRSARRPRTAS